MNNKQNTSAEIQLIPFGTICAAVAGDSIAMQNVLLHYRRYIRKLCQCTFIAPGGLVHRYIDDELKQELEIQLLLRIPRFKIE